MPERPLSRRTPSVRILWLLVAGLLLLAACGGDGGAQATVAGDLPERSTEETPPTTEAPAPRPTSELAGLIQSGGSASTLPEREVGPAPVGLTFEAIGVSLASVVDVGVEPNGDMEIPGASEIGWYRYGPTPGAAGSSVLAAHIAWNGVDGVFRHLGRAEPGQRFTIAYDDGSTADYEVVAIRQYPKDQLPDELWSTTGDPQVVLITCGGSFNRALNSYDDNIVAYAVPV